MKKIGNYEVHPAAEVWPLLPPPEMDALCESVKARGLLEPIKLYEGQILDGRNRLMACESAGVKPRFEKLPKDTNPWDYSATVNGRRRHMESASQRAAVVLSLLEDAGAWERLREEARSRGAASQTKPAPKSAKNSGRETLPTRPPVRPRDTLAEKAGVSDRTAQDVITVREKDPEAFERVKAGDLSANAAAKQVRANESAPAPSEFVLTDEIGRTVPKHLHEAWNEMVDAADALDVDLRNVQRDWTKARRHIEALAAQYKSALLGRFLRTVDAAVESVHQAAHVIRSAAPFAACWKCDGLGCNHCEKTGAYSVASKDSVERELGKKAAG